LKKAYLAYHWISIYLAHIITSVILLHTINMKQPCFLIVVWHGKPGYFHNHMFVNSEQHLATNMDPRHLKTKEKQIFKGITLLNNIHNIIKCFIIWQNCNYIFKSSINKIMFFIYNVLLTFFMLYLVNLLFSLSYILFCLKFALSSLLLLLQSF